MNDSAPPKWVRRSMEDWENCATPDCENKVCTWAHDTLCYPCAEKVLGKPAMRAAYTRTHDGAVLDWSDVPGRL